MKPNRFILTVLGFIGIAVILIVASTLVGTTLPKVDNVPCSANTTTVSQIMWGCWTEGSLPTLVKLITAGVLTLFMLPFIMMLMEHSRLRELKDQMSTADYNDSPALLIGATFVAMCILVLPVPFSVLQNYLTFLVFRAGWFILKAIVAAYFLVALIAGVRRSSAVVEDFQSKGTNTIAILIGAALIGAALLV